MPVKLDADVKKLLKQAERRAQIRAGFYSRGRMNWRLADLYVRLEKFRQAYVLYETIARKKFPNNRSPVYETRYLVRRLDDDYLRRYGYMESKLGMALAYLGKDVAAQQQFARAREKFLASGNSLRSSYGRRIVRNEEFAKGYQAAQEQLQALEARYAETPEPDTLWQIVLTCSALENRARHELRWLSAAVEFLSKHADRPEAQSGKAYYQLAAALRRHELYEKAIEVVKTYIAKHPDGRGYDQDDAWWGLGILYSELGVFSEELRDKPRAGAAYQKAIEAYEAFKKKFPEHYRSKPSRSESGRVYPALADRQIGYLERALTRVGRTRR